MAVIKLSGIGDDEKNALEQAAEDAGMSLSGFCRTRLRAGYRLWDADGEFDVLEMQKRLDEKQPTDSSSSAPSEPKSAAKADRFEQQIKRNLPTSEDDAVSKEELIETMSTKVVLDILKDLKDRGEVEYIVDQDGFVRK